MAKTRREFLHGTALLLTAALTGCSLTRTHRGVLLSAYENARGEQFVGGIRLSNLEVFGANIPMRAHGCAVDPRDAQRVIFFARRPGADAYVLALSTLKLTHAFTTPGGRHLAGHGVFSRDGQWLFTPEHDYENARGIIAVRDARDFKIEAELDSGGLDPHEVVLFGEELAVANGGIMTHPRSYRRKLNIDSMDSSFVLLDGRSGKLIEQHRLDNHLLSIRHLSVLDAQHVAAGLQFEGVPTQTPGLAAMYARGKGFTLLPTPTVALRQSKAYVASVLADPSDQRVLASCPRGRGVATWNASGRFEGYLAGEEVYGLSRSADQVLFASQRDGVTLDLNGGRRLQPATASIRWDDHWRWHEDAVTVPT